MHDPEIRYQERRAISRASLRQGTGSRVLQVCWPGADRLSGGPMMSGELAQMPRSAYSGLASSLRDASGRSTKQQTNNKQQAKLTPSASPIKGGRPPPCLRKSPLPVFDFGPSTQEC